jgi:microcystin-dependent protein
MAVPFTGEIRFLASDRIPADWVRCDGQLLSSGENGALAAALGNTFGGDGVNQFAVPDLRGRVPLQAVPLMRPRGQAGGQEKVALTVAQLPAHRHVLRASDSDGDQADPAGNVWARSEARGFGAGPADASMHAGALAPTGAGQGHDNLMPFLGVGSIIAVANGRTPDDGAVADVYVGEIRMFAIDEVPAGWIRCDGQLLSSASFPVLFDLMGTRFGGTAGMFAVPNLTGRVPIHRGPGRALAEAGGEESHTLTADELPAHSHQARAAGAPGDGPEPAGRTWGQQSAGLAYTDGTPEASMSPAALSDTGGGAGHDNMPPYLPLHFYMSLDGDHPTLEFPSTQPFMGEIRMFPYDAVPVGWSSCDGGTLNVADSAALFFMIGSSYGGDGQQTFALPDLRARAPLHPGQGPGLAARALGEAGGAASVTLTAAQLPSHTHEVRVQTAAGSAGGPAGQVFATAPARALSAGYSSQPPAAAMSPLAVSASEGGAAHNNMPPYLPINFCISLGGEIVV